MDTKLDKCVAMMRQLVSAVQGAPYPSAIENELYTIWFEHIQRSAIDCFEFLDANFPLEQADVSASLDRIL